MVVFIAILLWGNHLIIPQDEQASSIKDAPWASTFTRTGRTRPARSKEAQCTGFSVEHGHVGYRREAFHGEPYATFYLVREAFEADTRTAQIPAAILRERLARAIELALERERNVFGNLSGSEADPVIRSFTDFVELCERKDKPES